MVAGAGARSKKRPVVHLRMDTATRGHTRKPPSEGQVTLPRKAAEATAVASTGVGGVLG